MGRSEGEDEDSRHVVQRHSSHDHQRRHGGVTVDVVDKGDAQDRSAAPVGCLDDLATLRPAFAWQGQEKGNADAEKGGAETEQDELSVPDRAEIRLGQVHEQQRRQQCLEHELVQFPGGVVVQQVYFFHQTAEYHHQKYGNGGV